MTPIGKIPGQWILASIALALLSPTVTSGADTTSSDPSCFKKLQFPSYPELAQRARISATVRTSITLDDQGRVLAVVSQSDSKYSQVRQLLYPAVEAAIRASGFSLRCSGRTLQVVVHFVLDYGEPLSTPTGTNWFTYPNELFVTAPPHYYQPQKE